MGPEKRDTSDEEDDFIKILCGAAAIQGLDAPALATAPGDA